MEKVTLARSNWPHWATEAHAAGRALAYLEEAAADYGHPGPVGERMPRVRRYLGYALTSDRRAREWHTEGCALGRPWELCQRCEGDATEECEACVGYGTDDNGDECGSCDGEGEHACRRCGGVPRKQRAGAVDEVGE